MVSSTGRSEAEFDGLVLDPSPDGTKLLYVSWSTGAEGRLHIVDLKTRQDALLPVEGMPSPYAMNRAWFSPDGAFILFDFFDESGDHWGLIPATGGRAIRLGPKWPSGSEAIWAPDGRSVLALYPQTDGPSELRLLDLTGQGADRTLQVDVPYLPEWQRVAVSATP